MLNDKEMDVLMMAIMREFLNKKSKGLKTPPFTVVLEVTPLSISCRTEGNKAMIEYLGAEDWLKETNEKIMPIMREQAKKFAEIYAKKLGCEWQDVTKEAEGFADFLNKFSGQTM